FQAEDGIRDRNVTGVQTCALPICPPRIAPDDPRPLLEHRTGARDFRLRIPRQTAVVRTRRRANLPLQFVALERSGADRGDPARRSEERRVGKGGRTRGGWRREKAT